MIVTETHEVIVVRGGSESARQAVAADFKPAIDIVVADEANRDQKPAEEGRK